ncbi:hypothetical protein [Pacificibacter sp. AS14]|uniref:hypothetical protein n=1 Tax=Pacificibacter sp. AS14 TaxID=3135785 RepID=UPI0031811F46
MKKEMWNVKTPFFRPIWRRAVACLTCLAWAGVELVYGNAMFGALFLVAGAYLVYQFFITFNPKDFTPPPES